MNEDMGIVLLKVLVGILSSSKQGAFFFTFFAKYVCCEEMYNGLSSVLKKS